MRQNITGELPTKNTSTSTGLRYSQLMREIAPSASTERALHVVSERMPLAFLRFIGSAVVDAPELHEALRSMKKKMCSRI